MKKTIFPVAIIATLILSAFTTFKSSQWNISNNYSIKFTSDNPSGIFKSLKGDVIFNQNDLTHSSFNMIVDVKSINTGNGIKNKHAISKKWFDADQYPHITFKSKKITKANIGYEAHGMLELHGVQKEIVIPFTFNTNTFVGSIEINRVDYKLGATTGPSGKAAKVLKVDISVPVTK